MIQLQTLIDIARRIQGPVGRLDSLLIPLAGGGVDGHGKAIGSGEDLRDRLAENLGDARAAIETAQLALAMHFNKER